MREKIAEAERFIGKHERLDLRVGELDTMQERFVEQWETDGIGEALFDLITSAYRLGLIRGVKYRKKRNKQA